MKALTSIPLFLAILTSLPAYAGGACDDQYISEGSPRGAVDVYLIPVPRDFDVKGVNVLQTYQTVSARTNPTFTCNMSGSNGQGAFQSISCSVTSNGRIFSPWGGQGIEIASDGNVNSSECRVDATFPCIEDGNGRRIRIDPEFVMRPGYWGGRNYKVVSNCKSGTIDIIAISKAFTGYAQLIRTKQTGFVNTYKSTPQFSF